MADIKTFDRVPAVSQDIYMRSFSHLFNNHVPGTYYDLVMIVDLLDVGTIVNLYLWR